MALEAGFARVDITPPVGPVTDVQIPMPGPGHGRYQEFERVQDPLYARAMVLKDEAARVAVVSVDSLGDGVGYGDHARLLISEATGIGPRHVMILDTHAYSTPDTLGLSGAALDRRWSDELGHRIAAAVERANKECVSVRAEVMGANLLGATQNPRPEAGPWHYEGRLGKVDVPSGPIDPELWMLRLAREDGKAIGALVNFACQPICLQSKPWISADFVGVALDAIEREGDPMLTALFANGSAGNVLPLMRGHVGLMRWVGQKIGGEARSLLRGESAVMRRFVEGPVRMWWRTVQAPRRTDIPSREEITRRLGELLRIVGEEAGDPTSKRSGEAWRQLRSWEEMDKVARMPETLDMTLQTLCIGDLLLIGVSGNLFCELGLQIKSCFPDHLVMVAGCANGCCGLIAPDSAYGAGGPEMEASRGCPFQRGTGEGIRDEMIEVVRAVCKGR